MRNAVNGINSTWASCGVNGCLWNSPQTHFLVTNDGIVLDNKPDSADYLFVGGVLGYDISGTLDGCANYGAVNGDKYTGGVLGQANTKGKTVATVVKNSANYGRISSMDNGVGGVVGGCTGIMTVENSNNYGAVSTAASSYVGGIVGHGTTVTVKGCNNYGDIECGGNTKRQAGIVGWGVSGSAISNSNNYGDIAGVSNVGGIAGGISADTTITDCANFGKPTGKNTVGDIFGYQAK